MTRKGGNGDGTVFRRKSGGWAAAMTLPDGLTEVLLRSDPRGGTQEAGRRHSRPGHRPLHRRSWGDCRSLPRSVACRGRQTLGPPVDVHGIRGARPAPHQADARTNTPRPALSDAGPVLDDAKLKEGLSPKSVRGVRATLRAGLNQAMRWGMINRNAATAVELPRSRRLDIQPLTSAEARTFLESIRGDRLQALHSVALTMGLRQGEALGLRWSDVDLELGYLRITKQLQRGRRRSAARGAEDRSQPTYPCAARVDAPTPPGPQAPAG